VTKHTCGRNSDDDNPKRSSTGQPVRIEGWSVTIIFEDEPATRRNRPAAGGGKPSKASRLRRLLEAPDLRFLMEAHNGLSAKIVQETGFEGIWASGLSISTALGVRDNNEASWTQVLEVLEFMSDGTDIPILLDGDTGYGNFNNFRRLVTKLCARNIAGVCIEDKLFLKTNSFIGEHQPLADIEEFCGKIRAGKDCRTDDDFCIVARVEALIAGRSMDEALLRAEAYHAAGADAILIHSKQREADEILTFCRHWDDRCPVVVVPTRYYTTPTEQFRQANISIVIWANHNLRAAIAAMREVCSTVKAEESLVTAEGRVAPLQDVFALAGNDELHIAEKLYLKAAENVGSIILAATRGSALAGLTRDRPKCMLDVRGEALLRRQVGALNRHGIRDITVVAGYMPEAIDVPGIRKVVNPDWAGTGELASLACAAGALEGPCIVGYGDILFREFLLALLLKSDADFTVVVDSCRDSRPPKENGRSTADLVKCSLPFGAQFIDDTGVELEAIGRDLPDPNGRWVGLLKMSARGSRLAREVLDTMAADGSLPHADMAELLQRLIAQGERPAVVYVTGHVTDVNDIFDLAQARNEP
jgi:phosphoenolpyruvate phosphomutase